MNDNKRPIIALVGSMEYEVAEFEKKLVGRKDSVRQGIKFIEGEFLGEKVVLMCTGGGKVNAAISTTILIEYYTPVSVIFTGVGGALNPTLNLGDVVVARQTKYHDFGEITKGEFKAWNTWAVGNGKPGVAFFPADKSLFRIANQIRIDHLKRNGSASFEIVNGVIATGDVFCSSPKKKLEIFKNFGADVVEMDGAAVANVCWHYDIACLVVRGISDLTDDKAAVDYEENSRRAIFNASILTSEIVSQYSKPNFFSRAAG